MTILLTGADGFVGRHIQQQVACRPLKLDGAQVDLRKREQVHEAIRQIRPDVVLHLAAISSQGQALEQARDVFDVNFIGTFNLLVALKDTGFSGTFLFAGSGDCYGQVVPECFPITEDFPLRPRNAYAVSKAAAEALCYQWSQTEKFRMLLTRPFNHIGPGQSDKFAVASLGRQIAQIKRGLREPVIEAGNMEVSRDFTDVRDVVRAYVLLLEKGENGAVYNICSQREHSLSALLSQMQRLAGGRAEIRTKTERLRPAEQARACGSFEKLHHATGWQPLISMEQTLTDILSDWEQRLYG